jgi:hypothetical protein
VTGERKRWDGDRRERGREEVGGWKWGRGVNIRSDQEPSLSAYSLKTSYVLVGCTFNGMALVE